jgi:hypothetical protein
MLFSILGLFVIFFAFLILLGIANLWNKKIFLNKRFGISAILIGFTGLLVTFSFIFIDYLIEKSKTKTIQIEIDDNITTFDFVSLYGLLKEQTKSETDLKMTENNGVHTSLILDHEGNIIKFDLSFYGYQHGEWYRYSGSIHDDTLELIQRPDDVEEEDLSDYQEYLNTFHAIDFTDLMEDVKPVYDAMYLNLLESQDIDETDFFGYEFYFQYQDGFDWEQWYNSNYIHLIYSDGTIGPWDNDINGMDVSLGIMTFLIWESKNLNIRETRTLSQRYYLIDRDY